MKKNILFATSIIALTFFWSCTTTTEKHYGSSSYSKTNPSNVELLTDYPSRPYTEIGEIRGKGALLYTDGGDIKVAIRQTAADMGADAVILRGTVTKYDFWGLNNERKAIAIKWKGPKSSSDTETKKQTPASTSSGGLPNPQPVH